MAILLKSDIDRTLQALYNSACAVYKYVATVRIDGLEVPVCYGDDEDEVKHIVRGNPLSRLLDPNVGPNPNYNNDAPSSFKVTIGLSGLPTDLNLKRGFEERGLLLKQLEYTAVLPLYEAED